MGLKVIVHTKEKSFPHPQSKLYDFFTYIFFKYLFCPAEHCEGDHFWSTIALTICFIKVVSIYCSKWHHVGSSQSLIM